MSAWALQELWKSKVRRVNVCGRRSVFDSAFTIKEFREITKIPEVGITVPPFTMLDPPPARPLRRLMELVHEYTKPPPEDKKKIFALEYGLKPVEVLPSRVVFEVMTNASSAGWTGTGVMREIPAQLVIVSAGYRGVPIPNVPFDSQAGIIPNVKGAVVGHRGLFCSGWAKTGAKGVILSSIADAAETSNTILHEAIEEGVPPAQKSGKFGLVDLIATRKLEFVTYKGGWGRIEKTERDLGIDLGKSSEKVPDVETMLSIATTGSSGYNASQKFRGIVSTRPPGLEYMENFLDGETSMLPESAQKK
jgi:hypothetical protein